VGMTPGRSPAYGVLASPHPSRGMQNVHASPSRHGGPGGHGGGAAGMYSGRVTTQQVCASGCRAGAVPGPRPASSHAAVCCSQPAGCVCVPCSWPRPTRAAGSLAQSVFAIMTQVYTQHTRAHAPTAPPPLFPPGQAAGGAHHHHSEGRVPRHAGPRHQRHRHPRAAGAGGADEDGHGGQVGGRGGCTAGWLVHDG
jgi:hypothetical protein